MKKTILAALAALAVVAMVGCNKENPTTSSSEKVAAQFKNAAITRVADNKWQANDKIGVTMTLISTQTTVDGYLNVPYAVNQAGVSGTFSPVDEVVYFPVDGSSVDVHAYYPYAELDELNCLDVNVSSQVFSDIDIIATKVASVSKLNPIVTFSGDKAFDHQLSKLTLTIKAGEGIESLDGLSATIVGQYTTAKYNMFTSEVFAKGDVEAMTAVTSTVADQTKVEAILIPTSGVDSSNIVFTLGEDMYVWKTDELALSQGCEHNYVITITKTGLEVSGATINDWNQGIGGTGTAE